MSSVYPRKNSGVHEGDGGTGGPGKETLEVLGRWCQLSPGGPEEVETLDTPNSL